MTTLTGRKGTPVVGIAGWKNSGKTTLTERLVREFARRGFRVATVKHAHHSFQVDDAETDSARHRRAGAGQVAIVSRDRWAIIRELREAPEPELSDVLNWLEPCDLILVEGYKSAPIRKIEVRRATSLTKDSLAEQDPLVFAIAADEPFAHARLPVLMLDDITGIADLIADTAGLPALRAKPPA